eukprot:Nk52_evm9s2085 gene=Nk52_evmTU9s2085
MKTTTTWSEKITDKDGNPLCIYAVEFSPDGSRLMCGAGNKVLVYNTSNGEVLHTLKGHKDSVYCLSFAHDGSRFASGGADKTVIIWNENCEGILKYAHNDTIQCMAYNPLNHQLLSCTASDFGLWSSEQKSVSKHKLSSKALCCSWTSDGQYMALGLQNGQISIRGRAGEEKVRVERGNAPIWGLCWSPSKDEAFSILCVADWNQNLSFYQLSGRQIGKDRLLGYDPCTCSFFPSGDFIVVAGSNKQVQLYTKEGVKLGTVAKCESWVWCARVKPGQNCVAVASQDGMVSIHQMTFGTVHGLYNDRYAFRDNMTDVIIQNLVSEQRARIKCRDLVKKIAVYKDRLAVQLPDRVLIYEHYNEDGDSDMHYKIKERMHQTLECNLLVVTSFNIILCMDRRLQMLSFSGVKEREWVLESFIRYIKVIGGPPNREGLLIGLKNGQVLKIFIDNPFPIPLIKIGSSVRCIDMSCHRTKVAVINESNTCLVYDIGTKELLFQEPQATSVAWNTNNDGMLCYSGGGMLSIKASNFPVHQQKMQGFVVGFTGSKIFCLHVYAMTSIDVPQTASLMRYLDKNDFPNAYEVACLGVTDNNWRELGLKALEALQLDIARKAFIRIRDLRYLELIYSIEERKRQGEANDKLFLADIYAYQGKHQEAAKLYKVTGNAEKAMEMFSDLKQFDYAKEFLTGSDPRHIKNLIKRQAAWCKTTNDFESAARMYLAAGEVLEAVEIMGENGWMDQLLEQVRVANKADVDVLKRCAVYFEQEKQYGYCIEAYKKLNDVKSLVTMYVEARQWDEAFSLVEHNPEFRDEIYLPYATWLAENDKFEEAQEAFRKAGKKDEAIKVLEQLAHNAVVESRFDDAGYYFWMLSTECLLQAEMPDTDQYTREVLLEKYQDHQQLADLYYAYNFIHHYTEEPFTSHLPESLFNIARFVLHELATGITPLGISKMSTLFALAKQSRNLGAFKLATLALNKLSTFRVPKKWREAVNLSCLTIKSKPLQDREDLLPMCYRCSTLNPLLNNQGDCCVSCKHPFTRCFYSFENLPLVQFVLADGITDEEAERFILSEPRSRKSRQDQQRDIMDEAESEFLGDLFTQKLGAFDVDSLDYSPIVADEEVLLSLDKTQVFVKKWPAPLNSQYFKLMTPDTPVTLCGSCNRLFLSEDFEFAVLQYKACPFCRKSIPVL